MKKRAAALVTLIAVAAMAPVARASNVGFNGGVNIGNVPAPVYVSPPVMTGEPPEFAAQPAMGFYAAVGTPYDLFLVGGRYYLCRGDKWYSASDHNGPWVRIGYRDIPWSLRRHPVDRVRYLRDEERRHNLDDDGSGRGHFRPQWNDWHDGPGRWQREKPRDVAGQCRDGYRENREGGTPELPL